MLDRKSKYPGRFKIKYIEQAEGDAIVDFERADEPEVEGTKLDKMTILPDGVAAALGLDADDATPADAFMILAECIRPEVTAITVTENESTITMEIVNSDNTREVIESIFDADGKLLDLAVNGRGVAVMWE